MTDPRPGDPARMLAALAVQLERDRRAFLVGGLAYVAGNLLLAAVLAFGAGGPAAAWLAPAVAFLGNVFYALIADWEGKWEVTWRREVPRLERALGAGEVLTPIVGERGPRRIVRALRYVAWGVAAIWLLALLRGLSAAGLDWGLGG